MALWILSRTNPAADIWWDYQKLKKLVVRAPSADEAREIAATDQMPTMQKSAGRSDLHERPTRNPWRTPSDTSCDKVDSYTTLDREMIGPDGPAEVVARE